MIHPGEAPPTRVLTSRAMTRPMTEEQIRVRDLLLAEHRRLAANERSPVLDCK